MRVLRYIAGLALVLGLLVALRLPLLRCEPFIAGMTFFLDEAEYVAYANAFATGDLAVEYARPWTRAPLTSYLLLGIARLRGLPPELAACDFQLVQTALWGGLLLLISGIAALLFGRRTALITALLVAILPDGISLALLVHSDLLFCVWLAATVFALLMHTRHGHWGWLVVAGLTTGVGALARSPMLPLLPVLLLWAGARETATVPRPAPQLHLIAQPALDGTRLRALLRRMPALLGGLIRQHAGPATIMLLCCLAVVGPWTARNYRVHGGLIVSDTLGAINLLNDNAPERHQSFTEIMAAADTPIARQQYATRRAIEIIAADPLRFGRKVVSTGLLAWSPPHFTDTWTFWQRLIERPRLGALLTQLDTLLYALLPLVLLGLLAAPTAAGGARTYRLAAIVLAACYTAMISLTHFEARFRTPFLLLLLPYAAWCLAHPRATGAALRRPAAWAGLLIWLGLTLGFADLVWPAQWRNLQALALHGRGLARAALGDLPGALADQQAAGAKQPELREARVAAARLLAASGDPAGAEQTLRAVLAETAQRRDRTPPDATVALQALLLAEGRADEAAQLDRQLVPVNRRRAEALAWERIGTPGQTLALGPADLGLVRGFYSVQTSAADVFRWSQPTAQLRLAGAGDQLCLRLNAARPFDTPAPVIRLSAHIGGAEAALGSIQPPRNGWSRHCVALPAGRDPAAPLRITLATASYNPYLAGDGIDPRALGVAVAEAALRNGPLAVDPATGLLLDRVPTPLDVEGEPPLELLGLSGELRAAPGATLPLTLWWRSAEPPAVGSFTFLHLQNAAGERVAAYNAPLAADQRPAPWRYAEPLADPVALPLPVDLAPGSYRLIGGAFDPATGAALLRADLGPVEVGP